MAEYLSSMHEVWDSIFSKTYKRGKREKEGERKKKKNKAISICAHAYGSFLDTEQS